MKVLKIKRYSNVIIAGSAFSQSMAQKFMKKKYCSVVLEQKKKEKQAKCKHKNIDTHYEYIPGEAVMQPAYDYCVDCDKQIGWGERND